MNVSKGSLRIPPGVQHADVKIDAIIIDSSRKSGYMFQSDLNNTRAQIWVTVSVNHCSSSYLNLWDSLFNATFRFFRNDLRPPEMQPTDLTLPVTFSK